MSRFFISMIEFMYYFFLLCGTQVINIIGIIGPKPFYRLWRIIASDIIVWLYDSILYWLSFRKCFELPFFILSLFIWVPDFQFNFWEDFKIFFFPFTIQVKWNSNLTIQVSILEEHYNLSVKSIVSVLIIFFLFWKKN